MGYMGAICCWKKLAVRVLIGSNNNMIWVSKRNKLQAIPRTMKNIAVSVVKPPFCDLLDRELYCITCC